MHNWLRISHHRHTGRFRPHEYTSYPLLVLLLLIVGVALTVCSVTAASPGPEAGSVGLTGTMPGVPPKTAATISEPTNEHHFIVTPITISGTCPDNTLVEIYKNDIFAGSSTCDSEGKYSFNIDLMIGKNQLVARVYDALNQAGPDSAAVTVYYDALPQQTSSITPLSFGGSQLLINTDAVFRGAFPDKELSIPIDIIGGTPPFAVNIQWGDSTNKIIPRNDNLGFNAVHTYRKAGTYQITLQATDAQGRVAFMSVAAIVNGQPGTLVASSDSSSSSVLAKLSVLWPLYTASIAVVTSFWLGERREKKLLRRTGITYHPQ